LYTTQEQRLLSVRPGITDISSIVFADEGDILQDSADPDLLYNQIIRPWKSQLGLLYVDKNSIVLDVKLIVLTLVNALSRQKSLKAVQKILKQLGASDKLCQVCRRDQALPAAPPPGAKNVVENREGVTT